MYIFWHVIYTFTLNSIFLVYLYTYTLIHTHIHSTHIQIHIHCTLLPLYTIHYIYRYYSTVYRLIAQGTIEEKIYERQIMKITLSNKILNNNNNNTNNTTMANTYNSSNSNIFSKSQMKDFFTLNESHNVSLVNSSSRIGKPLNSCSSDLTLPKRGYIDINALSNNINIDSNTNNNDNIDAENSNNIDIYDTNSNSVYATNDEPYTNIADELSESNTFITTQAATNSTTNTTNTSGNGDDFAYTASDLFSTNLVTPDEEGEEGERGHNSEPSLEGYSITDFKNKTRQKEEEQRLLQQQGKVSSSKIKGRERESSECSDDDDDDYNNYHKPANKQRVNGNKVANKVSDSATIRSSKASTTSSSSSHDKQSKQMLTSSSITSPLLAPLPISIPTPTPTPFSGDQDVLKALFGSHSIASIYDHDYLESGSGGGGAHPSKLHPVGTYVTKAQLEKERIQKQIGNYAANAILSLQSSAKVFIPTSSSSASYSKLSIPAPVPVLPFPDSPIPRPVQANGGHIIQVLTDSDTTTNKYTTGGDGCSAPVSSSSDLLAQIRKRKLEESAAVNTARTSLTSTAPLHHTQGGSSSSGESSSKRVTETETEVTRNVIPLPTPSPLVPFSSSTATTNTSTTTTAQAPQVPEEEGEEEDGLEATLLRRLHLLFRQRGPQLATEKILISFADLGTSYIPPALLLVLTCTTYIFFIPVLSINMCIYYRRSVCRPVQIYSEISGRQRWRCVGV